MLLDVLSKMLILTIICGLGFEFRTTHFTTKVNQFLREVFIQGEDIGNKAIGPCEPLGLTSTQISTYFSRLAALNRGGALHRTGEPRPASTETVAEGGESKDEEEDPYVAETFTETFIIRTRLNICMIILILTFHKSSLYAGVLNSFA